MRFCNVRALNFTVWDVCTPRRLLIAVLLLFNYSVSANASFKVFDPPDSISTFATGINNHDEVVGNYETQDAHVHGFIRNSEGKIKTYDVPNTTWTQLQYIDSDGSIVGNYVDDSNNAIGFLLTSSGQLTSFQNVNAHINLPQGIDTKGRIVGNYENYYGDYAFLRRVSGSLVTILPHKSSVYAWAINRDGNIAGYCTEGGNYGTFHGFVTKGQVVKVFDPRNSSSTFAWSINDAGTITGDYWDSVNVGVEHGYVRANDGKITSFDVGQGGMTTAVSINNNGEIVGGGGSSGPQSYVRTANGPVTPLGSGYVRAADGTITTFNIQGAADIAPTAINDNGVVVGWYQDQSGEVHGFVGVP